MEKTMQKGKCVHFNGIGNDYCMAGINYKTLAGEPEEGYIRRLPCLAKYAGDDAVKCEAREEPTSEAVANWAAEIVKRFDDTVKARTAIVNHLGRWKKGTGMNGHGSIQCPVCKGIDSLRFSRAGWNGHIHAHCQTAGCVSWME